MTDTVFIEELKVPIRIGCEAEERKIIQTISVDLEIEVETSKAAQSKNIDDTICYKTVCEMIQSLAAEKEYVLLEEFGETILSQLKTKFSSANKSKITIRKFVISEAKSVGVKLVR